ncbi:MAG: hypothetical protein GYA55_05320 [SAR324 cluster bacterium]|uniref:Uncharacterized protein n=1 Tax=SAR324 cluster bacterium TaxID=2024889 RepID=A0A7X9FQY0_9DELT|nr:hypothetical protein [SAR324 cluster bacterium]
MKDSNFLISWNLFPPGYQVDFRLFIKKEIRDLQPLFNLTWDLCGSLVESGKNKVLDIKGRGDRDSLYDNPQQPERLFFVSGSVVSEEEGQEVEGEKRLVPFSYCLQSSFDSFVGARHISYNLHPEGTGAAEGLESIKEFLHNNKLLLDTVWLGVDLFTGTFLGTYLGFTPVVRDSFLLEYSKEELRFELNSESLKTRDEIPFERNAVLGKVRDLIDELSNEDLQDIYRAALSKESS